MKFRADVSEALALLDRIASLVDWSTETGERIARSVRREVRHLFLMGGDPPWPPPRDSSRPGIRTGRLLASWTDARDTSHVTVLEETAVQVGTSLSYAGRFHGAFRPVRLGMDRLDRVASAALNWRGD